MEVLKQNKKNLRTPVPTYYYFDCNFHKE